MGNTILLVDDSLIIQILLKKVLGNKYNVVSKSNGAQALDWIRNGNSPSLIITDLIMPIMDGINFTEHLRQENLCSGVPVILLTSYNQEIEVENLNVYRVVSKPIDIQLFTMIIKEALELETLI